MVANVTSQIVSAIVETLLFPICQETSDDASDALQQTQEMIVRRLNLMPGFLRSPMVILILVFDGWAVLRRGRRFQKQSMESRCQQIAQWRHAKVGPCREFIVFYEKFSAFIYYSYHVRSKH